MKKTVLFLTLLFSCDKRLPNSAGNERSDASTNLTAQAGSVATADLAHENTTVLQAEKAWTTLTPNRTVEFQRAEYYALIAGLRSRAAEIESVTKIRVVDDFGNVVDPLRVGQHFNQFCVRRFGRNSDGMRSRHARTFGTRLGLALFRIYAADNGLKLVDGMDAIPRFSVANLAAEICIDASSQACSSLLEQILIRFEAKYADYMTYIGLQLLDDYGGFLNPGWIFGKLCEAAYKAHGSNDATLRRIFVSNWGIDCGLALHRFWLLHRAEIVVPRPQKLTRRPSRQG